MKPAAYNRHVKQEADRTLKIFQEAMPQPTYEEMCLLIDEMQQESTWIPTKIADRSYNHGVTQGTLEGMQAYYATRF